MAYNTTEDCYPVPSAGDKRILVLFNVHKYYDDPEHKMYRPTQKDTECLTNTFGKLGFDVKNFTKTDSVTAIEAKKTIQSALSTITQDPDNHSCLALCIMTHGTWYAPENPSNQKKNLDEIFLFSDHKELKMDDIVSWVNECEGLQGKPKLFFIQACRGARLFGTHELTLDKESTVVKAERVKKERINTKDGEDSRRAILHPMMPARVSLFPDCLISWATSPDYASFKSSAGAPYITHLCSTLEANYTKLDLLTMVTIANGRVAEEYAAENNEIEDYDKRKQMPWLASMFRKKFFLNTPEVQ